MNKCYCIHCGVINDSKRKKRTSCHKRLRPFDKDLEFLITDNLDGELRGSIVNAVLTFIKSHMYGVILSITLVSVVVPNIILAKNDAQKVVEKPSVLLSNENAGGYSDYKVLFKDLLVSLDKKEDISKYRYTTYYDIGNTELEDRYDYYVRQIEYLENTNEEYFLEYIRGKYEDVNEDDVRKYGIGNENLYNDIEDVELYYVYLMPCYGDDCHDQVDYGMSPIDLYYFNFVKRDGKWYFLRVSPDTAENLPDDKDYGYILNGVIHKYPSMEEEYELEQNRS